MRIVQPVMWVAPVYFMGVSFSVDGEAVGFAASTGTSEFLAFILLGSVVSSYVSAVLWGIGFSLKQEMEQGTLESLWLTPNSRLWLMVGTQYHQCSHYRAEHGRRRPGRLLLVRV